MSLETEHSDQPKPPPFVRLNRDIGFTDIITLALLIFVMADHYSIKTLQEHEVITAQNQRMLAENQAETSKISVQTASELMALKAIVENYRPLRTPIN